MISHLALGSMLLSGASLLQAAVFVPATDGSITVHAGQVTAKLLRGEVRIYTRGRREPIRLRFEDARAALPVAFEQLESRVNFFLGPNARQWRTNVPTFAKARYKSLWTGIDAEFYGTGRAIEYDLIVQPGADVSAVRFRIDSARAHLDPSGDLTAPESSGEFRHRKPRASQEGREISAEYVALGHGTMGIRVGAYDHSKPLIIDPIITYSTYLGGGNQPSTLNAFLDAATAIAVDAAGNAYVTGTTASPDFPIIKPAYLATNPAPTNQGCFVSKIDPTGSRLIYSSFFYGSCASIAVDSAGSAYVGGYIYEGILPVTPGAALTKAPSTGVFNGLSSGYLTKFSPDGSKLVYSTYVAGNVQGVAVDVLGNAYVTGLAGTSSGFVATAGALQSAIKGGADAFVTKINPAGSAFVYSTLLGGAQDDGATAIALDGGGNAYVTGTTGSTDFPVTPSAFQRTCGCVGNVGNVFYGIDAFVAKLNPTGTALMYSTYLGGTQNDTGAAIAVDATGSTYITGNTGSKDFPTTPGSFLPQAALNGSTHSFVTKLDPSGSGMTYSTFLAGEYSDSTKAIVVDSGGNAWVAGTTNSLTFPTTADAFVAGDLYFGWTDAFLTRFDSTGSKLLFSTRFGGDAPDVANSLALGSNGDIYMAGSASSDDMPVTPNALQQKIAQGYTGSYFQQDAFVARISVGDLSIWPGSLLVENVTSHALPVNVTLNVNSYGIPRTFATQTASDSGWLSAAPNGITAQSLTLSASPNGLKPGSYSGSVTVVASGARVVPSPLLATLVVAELRASDNRLNFRSDNLVQTLRVMGGTGLYFTASADAPWLRVDHGAGVTPSQITVTADPAGLTSGTYSGTINLTPRNAPADTVTVNVVLTVP